MAKRGKSRALFHVPCTDCGTTSTQHCVTPTGQRSSTHKARINRWWADHAEASTAQMPGEQEPSHSMDRQQHTL